MKTSDKLIHLHTAIINNYSITKNNFDIAFFENKLYTLQHLHTVKAKILARLKHKLTKKHDYFLKTQQIENKILLNIGTILQNIDNKMTLKMLGISD